MKDRLLTFGIVAFGVIAGTRSATAQELPPGWSVELVAEGIDMPTGIGFTPDKRWMLIIGKQMQDILAFDLVNNKYQDFPVTSITSMGDVFSETGNFSIVCDPDFTNYPYFYVCHTQDSLETVVTRIHVVETADAILGDSLVTILGGIPVGSAHNGGILKFGKDGYLYLSIGEHDAPGSQDTSILGGKFLRMTRDGLPAPGNPFLTDPLANPYVYTFGHRNNFGIAVDPVTGAIWAGDVGPSFPHFDEINILKAGANYGWQTDPYNDVTGPLYSSRWQDPVWWGTAGEELGGMPTPVGMSFVHSWRYPAEVLGDLFVWWQGNHRLHHARRSGDSLEKIQFQEIFLEGILPGLALEQGPDGWLYYSIFFSPYGAIARIKYDESLLPPVSVAVRGNISVGGLMTIYVSSKPQEPVENYHLPLDDFAAIFIGDWIDPFETPYGTLQISNYLGMVENFDAHGVATTTVLIPDDAAVQGLSAQVQAFRVFGGDGYSTGVTAAPVTFTIQ